MRFFQREHALIAHPLGEHHGGIFTQTQELRVCAAIRQTGHDERVAHDLPDCVIFGVIQIFNQEHRSQSFAERDFAECMEWWNAHVTRDFRYVAAFELRLLGIKNLHSFPVASPQAILVMVQIMLQARPHCGIFKVGEALFHRAGQRLVPFRHVIEQVVFDEVEQRFDAMRVAERENAMTLVHVFQANQRFFPLAGQVVYLQNGVVVDRSSAQLRPTLQHERFFRAEMQRLRRHFDRADIELACHGDQGFSFFGARDQARQHRTVVVAVDQIEIGGESQCAGTVTIADQFFHLFQFFCGHLLAPRIFFPEHPRANRRLRDISRDVHADACAFERFEIITLTHPVPAHPLFHGSVGDGLDARHSSHRAFPVFGSAGREPEAAGTDHDTGDAVPARLGSIGVPVQLRIVMRVHIDKAGCHDETTGVDFLAPRAAHTADLCDEPVLDCDITVKCRHPRAIDNPATPDD